MYFTHILFNKLNQKISYFKKHNQLRRIIFLGFLPLNRVGGAYFLHLHRIIPLFSCVFFLGVWLLQIYWTLVIWSERRGLNTLWKDQFAQLLAFHFQIVNFLLLKVKKVHNFGHIFCISSLHLINFGWEAMKGIVVFLV